MQRAAAREMRQQVLHLVGQHAPAFQEDVFGVGGREWNRNELHFRLLGRSILERSLLWWASPQRLQRLIRVSGAERIGASVIPTSTGNTRRQLKIMRDFKTTALVATPGYAIKLGHTLREQGTPRSALSLRVALLGGEPLSDALRQEIQEIADGKADKQNNVLKNAPHTADAVTSDTWDRPYGREKAAFPLPYVRAHKFWPSVGRVNNAYGDRNLVCTCPPVEEYEEATV